MLFDDDIKALAMQKKYGFFMDPTRDTSGEQYYNKLLRRNLITPGTPAYEFLALTKKSVI